MSKFLHRYIRTVGHLNEGVGRAVSWLTAVLVVLVCGDVIIRYLLKDTAAWIMELEWHLFALVFILGAAYTFKHDKHVRVDLFYDKFNEKEGSGQFDRRGRFTHSLVHYDHHLFLAFCLGVISNQRDLS